MKNEEQKQLENFHFKILKGEKKEDGKIEKSYQAGVALLREGQQNYMIHIYILQHNEFFLVPHKVEPGRYYIMTRRPTKNPNKKAKYEWNIVGHGRANSRQACIELNFDLFSEPLYMNIFPMEKCVSHELKLSA